MNILPFVTILILVISLTISSFFGGFKECVFAKMGEAGLMNAYRLARNSAEDERLATFAETLPKEEKEPREKKSNPKTKKKKDRYFRENITDHSKFNLFPLIKDSSSFLEETFALLIAELYLNTDLVKEYKYEVKSLPKLLAKEILQTIRNLPEQEESLEFETITLPNKHLHAIWYKMLKGAPGSWPPFSTYVRFNKNKNKTAIFAKKAAIPVLKAFFGDKITQAIIEKEQEEKRAKAPLNKEEFITLLGEHGFDTTKRSYIQYGYDKTIRHTESEQDPNSGITAHVFYSTPSTE